MVLVTSRPRAVPPPPPRRARRRRRTDTPAAELTGELAELGAQLHAAVAALDDVVWDIAQRARPKARGWLHAASAVVAPAAAAWLVGAAEPGPKRAAAAVYGAGMCAMFAASGSYHRLARTRLWWERLRRVDHSMIYVMIAGTWTPVAVATLPAATAAAVLAAVWGSTALAVRAKVRRLSSTDSGGSWFYAVLGCSGVAMLVPLAATGGSDAVRFFVAGGVAYLVGGAMFAAHRPNPWPHLIGFHELFHAAVVAGAALQFAAIADLVRAGS